MDSTCVLCVLWSIRYVEVRRDVPLASTNQSSRKIYSVISANAKGGTNILGAEDTKVSGTVKHPVPVSERK